MAEGLDKIPLRVPAKWDPEWFATFVRDTLSQADVRNAIEGVGVSITGQSDEPATIAASDDVLDLLSASLLTVTPSGLTAARQLVGGDGIEIDDGGPGNEASVGIAEYGITLDKLAQVPGLSIIGSQNTTPGTFEVVTAAANDRLLTRTSNALDFTQLTVGMFPDAVVTYAKIQNADALSVLGRASNSAGVLDELVAGTDGNIVRRSGTAVGFGSIDLAAAGAVGSSRLAFANVAQITGQAVLGVASSGAGNLAAISAGTDDRVLAQTSGTVGFVQLTAGMFPSTVVPDAALSSNVALLSRDPQTFAGATRFSNATPSSSAPAVRIGNTGTTALTAALSIVHAGFVYATIRNTTNSVEAFLGAATAAAQIGTATNHPVEIQTNGSTRVSIAASATTITSTAITLEGTVTLGANSTTPNHRLNNEVATTVGAAGAASALPATPEGYLRVNVNGTIRKIPYYLDA